MKPPPIRTGLQWMMRPIVAAMLVPLLCLTRPTWASDLSEVLVSRWLLAFHKGDYPNAFTSFDAAVGADPVNVEALYYRAMTRARLGDLDEATIDLGVALYLKPDFYEAALQLGVAHMRRGNDREAIPWLERARASPALDADASLLLGIAGLHLGDTEAASADLERAARKENVHGTARYYQGVASYRRWRWDDAKAHFSHVAATQPDVEIGRQAAHFLREVRPYHVHAELGLNYDSNVVLAPSDNSVKSDVGITDQADGRVSLTLGGTAVPLRNQRLQLLLGYEFFQSFQFELPEFNLQGHQPSAELLINAGPIEGGVAGRYAYYLLDTDSFLQEALAAPWLAVPEGDIGRSEIFYRMRLQEFLERPFREVRDSVNHAAGLRQYFYLTRPERYLMLGYRFERQNALESEGDAFAYDAHEVQAGVGWELMPTLDGAVSYAYRHEDYDAASDGRRDGTNHVVVSLRKGVTEWLWVSASYLGTFNDSNQAVFDYNRHIVSVALGVRL